MIPTHRGERATASNVARGAVMIPRAHPPTPDTIAMILMNQKNS
jgi:hypothetical protein